MVREGNKGTIVNETLNNYLLESLTDKFSDVSDRIIGRCIYDIVIDWSCISLYTRQNPKMHKYISKHVCFSLPLSRCACIVLLFVYAFLNIDWNEGI